MSEDDRISVLVVDDDESICEMISTAFESEGIEVHVAGDGAQALDVLRDERIDVVVLDIMMPKVDGWMALMEIRNDPAIADTPVIMLTAKNQDLAKILAFKQGVQQYVTKPFNVMELAARVRSLAGMQVGRSGGESGEFRKLAVRKAGRTVLLEIPQIVFIQAKNKSTYVHTYEQQYIVDLTLSELEERLARDSFHRVHRSFIINLDCIKEITREEGSHTVVVADRDETPIPVARRNVRSFREAVGI